MLTLNPQTESLPDMSALNPSNIDTALKHAEGWPITVGFFFMVVIMAAALYWLLFRFYPSWQAAQATRAANLAAEAAATRQHMTDVLNARGAEATKDVQSITTAIGNKVDNIAKDIDGVEALTRDLSGKFAEVHNKVSGIHDILVRAMANKTSVVGVLLVLCGTIGYVGAWSCLPMRRGVATAGAAEASAPVQRSTPQKQCSRNSDCPHPQYCHGGFCVRNATSREINAATPPKKQPDGQANSQPRSGDLYRDYDDRGGIPAPYTVEWRREGAALRWL